MEAGVRWEREVGEKDEGHVMDEKIEERLILDRLWAHPLWWIGGRNFQLAIFALARCPKGICKNVLK